MHCHVCGMKFRSMLAEAKHRHNFPALCKRNKMFRKNMADYEREKAAALAAKKSAETSDLVRGHL